jgi:hypothetical protein
MIATTDPQPLDGPYPKLVSIKAHHANETVLVIIDGDGEPTILAPGERCELPASPDIEVMTVDGEAEFTAEFFK